MEESLQSDPKASFREMNDIIRQHEKKVRNLETQMMHLAMFYVSFQSIIFLSISHPSSAIKCANRWIPLLLSLSIAVIFFITFINAIMTWERMQYHHDQNIIDRELIYQRIQSDKSCNGPSSSPPQQRQRQRQRQRQPDMVKVYQRCAYMYLAIAIMVAFTALVLHSCRSIPCHGHGGA